MSEKNKIRYGIKNCYAAVAMINDDNSATYGTPFAVPGAVSLSLDPQGENTPFHADNIVYWIGASNEGYEGDLEVALISDEFHEKILAETKDSNGVLIEDADVEAVHFAFMFQIEGDRKATRHVLYNCTATRPSVGGETKEDTVEPQTESTTITATTIYVPSLDKNLVKGKTTLDTNADVYADWFKEVYVPQSLTPSLSLTVGTGIAADFDLLGKTVGDLQSGISVANGAISGISKYVSDYTGFSSIVSEQSGNYLALKCDVTNAADATIKAELVGGTKGEVTLDDDKIIVFRVTSNSQSVKVTASKEGYEDVVKTYTLDGLTLEEE